MPVPYQKYRIDPRDLNKNIAIGVALPFSSPGVFTSTFSTKEQVKYNLINLILTNKGERIENPEFGSDVRRFIFEFITDQNTEALKSTILTSITRYIPEIVVRGIEANPDPDANTISLKIIYEMKLSGDSDNVTIEFE